MKLAGPFVDDAGGAVLLAVADESEAKVIVAEHPAVKSGIFVHEMHPWEIAVMGRVRKESQNFHPNSRAAATPHPHSLGVARIKPHGERLCSLISTLKWSGKKQARATPGLMESASSDVRRVKLT
jgi:hypothetical protein